MGRLIDADKIAEAITWLNEYDFIIYRDVMKSIGKLPTVEVVEIVRCKDCKYWKDDDCKNDSHGYCPRNENDFCPWGERKYYG